MLQKKELSGILISLISAKMLLTYPIQFIKNSGNAAWIQVIFVTLLAVFLFYIVSKIYDNKTNIIELSKISTNRVVKIIVGVIIFIILLMNIVKVMRIFPESVKIILLQETDTEIIVAVFALTILIGATYGIEAISKINYIFLPICAIVLGMFIILLIPYYRLDNIFPILGNGVFSLFVKGINGLSMFSDIIVLSILLGYSKNVKDARSSGYKAIIISGAVAFLITLVYGLIYPYPISEDFMFPVYQVTRMIHLGSFFNRFEAIFQFIWSMLIFLYGSIYIFVMCFVWQMTFDLKYFKPLALPVTIIVSACSLIPESMTEIVRVESIIDIIIYPMVIILPIIIGSINKRRSIKEDEKV